MNMEMKYLNVDWKVNVDLVAIVIDLVVVVDVYNYFEYLYLDRMVIDFVINDVVVMLMVLYWNAY
jgi:hypothetical protein